MPQTPAVRKRRFVVSFHVDENELSFLNRQVAASSLNREELLNSLSHLKSYQEKLDTMRMGIQVEIQRLAKQKHNLERIYAQGLIEDSQYLERKALIEQQLFEKKEFLTRKPLAGNIDRLLKNTRLIKRLFGTCQPLMYFDKQVFTSLVSKVTISDTSFEFELINGMRVSERRTSK